MKSFIFEYRLYKKLLLYSIKESFFIIFILIFSRTTPIVNVRSAIEEEYITINTRAVKRLII